MPPESPVSGDSAESIPPAADTGLMALVLIARFHQTPVTPEGLRHQYAPPPEAPGKPALFGDVEILRAAKELGFRAKTARVTPASLQNAVLPLLAKHRDGSYFILVQTGDATSSPLSAVEHVEEKSAAFFLAHMLSPKPGPRKFSEAELKEICTCPAIPTLTRPIKNRRRYSVDGDFLGI